MLTRKQYELLNFIHTFLEKEGVSPSFDEMKEALGLRSKSGIHRLISALEERGFLRRHHHRARALEVLRLPSNEKALLARRQSMETKRDFPLKSSEVVALPLYGRIAAGTPIQAIRDTGEKINVPTDMLGRGRHYALRVTGDSMVNAGILNGDFALIREEKTAENGQIVVALIDAQEATLKRFRRSSSNLIALEAANPLYETRLVEAERVQLQGVLAGLFRHYK